MMLIFRNNAVDFIMTYSLSVAYFYFIGFIFQFACAAIACRDRFLMINEKLSRKIFFTYYEMQAYIELYQKLLKIMEHINEYLAPPLIPVFTMFLVLETFMTYTVVRLLLHSGNQHFMIAMNLMWSSIYYYLSMIAMHSSESAYKEGFRFKNICYEILCFKGASIESTRTLKMFLASITHSRLQLRTIFFDINWMLLLEMCATITMFIIITIQFDTSLPSLSIVSNTTTF